MPLKRFVGATATEALSRARREAGKDALIVATRTLTGPGHQSRPGLARYEVLVAHEASVATAPPTAATGTPALSAEVARVHRMLRSRTPEHPNRRNEEMVGDDPLSEALYRELRPTGLSASTSSLLVSRVRPRLSLDDLGDPELLRSLVVAALADLLASQAPDLSAPARRRRIVLVGPPGAGKTTAATKLAFHFALRRRRPVALLSVDREKAGASARIEALAAAARLPFRAAGNEEEIAAALQEMDGAEITIVDTSSAAASFGDPLASLGPLASITANAELYLVLSGAAAPALTRRVLDLYRALGLTGVILTMLDASLPLGETVESLLAAGLAVAFLSTGPEVSDGIEIATAHRVAALVLQSARWVEEVSS
jgi:flagellar biosynthesis protein FlhF